MLSSHYRGEKTENLGHLVEFQVEKMRKLKKKEKNFEK